MACLRHVLILALPFSSHARSAQEAVQSDGFISPRHAWVKQQRSRRPDTQMRLISIGMRPTQSPGKPSRRVRCRSVVPWRWTCNKTHIQRHAVFLGVGHDQVAVQRRVHGEQRPKTINPPNSTTCCDSPVFSPSAMAAGKPASSSAHRNAARPSGTCPRFFPVMLGANDWTMP